jgi:uncharacterized protein (TIGR03086 family)
MDAKDLFGEAVKEAGSCVKRIEATELNNATPCSDWDLKALVNHMVYELAWAPDLLAGKRVAEVGNKYDGDLLRDDLTGSWQQVTEAALAAVVAADFRAIVHLSYGDFPTEHYISELGSDILIHGWDAGQATNCSIIFNPKVARSVYTFVKPRANEFRQSGLFADPLPTSPKDTVQTKLLAFFGRKEPDWSDV